MERADKRGEERRLTENERGGRDEEEEDGGGQLMNVVLFFGFWFLVFGLVVIYENVGNEIG